MKVIVGGCSVSDYSGPDIERVYGEILAEKIGADYIHHGAGIGSNYRIWRVITKMVMNNEIDKDDIVLIQYTDITRQEYWSANIANENYRFDQYKKIEQREQKYNGDIIRWKLDAHTWHKTYDEEQKFFKLKQDFFTSSEFDEERFEYNHFLFHNLMMSRNIKVAYFVPESPINSGIGGGMGAYSLDNIHLFNKNGEIHITEGMSFQYPGIHLQDMGHFNQRGHEYVAKVLEKFIKKKQWI
jgi:hypothetical protein